MRGQEATVLHHAKHEVGVEGIAGVTQPPTGITETDHLHAVLHLEPPGVAGVARELLFDAVLVGRRSLHHFEFGMSREHLVMDPADPVTTRTNFTVRHRKQIPA